MQENVYTHYVRENIKKKHNRDSKNTLFNYGLILCRNYFSSCQL